MVYGFICFRTANRRRVLCISRKNRRGLRIYMQSFLDKNGRQGGGGVINTATADVSSEHRDTDIFFTKELAFKGFVSDLIGTLERSGRG